DLYRSFSLPPFATMEEEGKDSRKERKLAEEMRNHHKLHVVVGPGTVMKSGGKEGEMDPFGVGCSGVAHSLNKDKRWEKVEREQELLEKKIGDATFIKASVPIKSSRYLYPMPAGIEDIHAHKGGYTSVTTARDGEVEKKCAKSDKSKLHMLVDEDAAESTTTTYTAITLRKGGPKANERGWRSIQAYGMPKEIQRRVVKKETEDKWNDRRQEELEEELEISYEKQMGPR
ncbi:hypothetical protein PMAYCL1PPCAC_16666, partial [Pristionchus mayeri]